MSDELKTSAYDKLTPQRKQLVDAVLKNLEKGTGLWEQGWSGGSAPVSAITGKQYNGVNRVFLLLASMEKGYSDNRWLTYKQMEDKGWHFKTDEEGKSLGKGAGVAIEYFELRDKETKQPFDRHTLDGMTAEERAEYMDENVYPLRKYYRVFNGDVIEGIPERKRAEHDPSGQNARAEALIGFWSDTESPIRYGGSAAYYSPKSDEIHLPQKEDFVDMPEYYSTALHEIGHSTGHEKRLNRSLSSDRSSSEYATEELRAEIASMFLEQDLGVAVKDKHIENNSAYIAAWKSAIKEDPNIFFKAIADAERITKFVMAKEKEIKKETEAYAVVEETDEYGEPVYKVMMASEHGQTQYALSGYPFRSREALMAEFGKMQELPFWKGKQFEEVSREELEARSIKRAEEQDAKAERLSKIQEEKSDVFAPPSEFAASMSEEKPAAKAADMSGRGIDSLTRMEDRELVERASKTKQGAKFSALFNGIAVLGSEEKKGNHVFQMSKRWENIKPKDMIGIPWMLAFALRDFGYYLRSDIIWHKINCLPESVKDRPAKCYEHIFLLSKSPKYYYDYKAIQEPIKEVTAARYTRGRSGKAKYSETKMSQGIDRKTDAVTEETRQYKRKRDVWEVSTNTFRMDEHFAMFPERLIEPCILAGSKEGDTVLDPFFGSGTTGAVAKRFGREYIGIDLNPRYLEKAEMRIAQVIPEKPYGNAADLSEGTTTGGGMI